MRNLRLKRSACVLGLLFAVSDATGATYVVTNLTDGAAPGPAGSLRKAVSDANADPGSTIVFQVGLTGTIALVSGQLPLTSPVTITGPGANVLIISGNNSSRVFNINAASVADISGLTITNGNAGGANGGGILNSGTLTLTSCAIQNNKTSGEGGGIWSGSNSLLTVTRSLIASNQASFGAALEHYSVNPAVLTNVTVSGNTCTDYDTGPIEANSGGTVNLESCTVTGNTSGLSNSGGINAYLGGGARYRNTIVSGNTGKQFVVNSGGTLTSLGHNISSDGTGNLIATGDLPNTNPLLGPLTDNGGPTLTHALLTGSPAIDAGDPATFPPTDQRGVPRPLDGNGDATVVTDIGAFECAPPIPADFDNDRHVDAEDLAIFTACVTGPAVPYDPLTLPAPPPGCTLTPVAGKIAADFDSDSDVDMDDFGKFQRCYSGPTRFAVPNCAN